MDSMEYVLGLDIGTTSVKVAIVEQKSRRTVAVHSLPSNATLQHSLTSQDVHSILATIDACIEALPPVDLHRVTRIGVCGQMHGVCLWKKTAVAAPVLAPGSAPFPEFSLQAVAATSGLQCSPLYTWMDDRCDLAFIATLPKPDSHLKLATGHGCATLFWLKSNGEGLLKEYEHSGTIMDLVVALLCGRIDPIMSGHNAASWGYFNTARREWNRAILEAAGFPVRLLPAVATDDHVVAGQLHSPWKGIAAGVKVSVAWGDLQCSVLSTRLHKDEALVNISTSAQIGHIVEGELPVSRAEDGGDATTPSCVGVEYFPYFNGAHFAVGASLNGGNVLSAFVRMLSSWYAELLDGQPLEEDVIWSRILQAAAATAAGPRQPLQGVMQLIPTLHGERHAPSALASVSNVSPTNTSLGHVTRAICTGITRNLVGMMPLGYLRDAGIKTMVLTGSTFARNPILLDETTHVFVGFYLRMDSADAAVGAAFATAKMNEA